MFIYFIYPWVFAYLGHFFLSFLFFLIFFIFAVNKLMRFLYFLHLTMAVKFFTFTHELYLKKRSTRKWINYATYFYIFKWNLLRNIQILLYYNNIYFKEQQRFKYKRRLKSILRVYNAVVVIFYRKRLGRFLKFFTILSSFILFYFFFYFLQKKIKINLFFKKVPYNFRSLTKKIFYYFKKY